MASAANEVIGSTETGASLYPTTLDSLLLSEAGTRTVTHLSTEEKNIIRAEARTEKTRNLLIAATINLVAFAILGHFVTAGAITFIGYIVLVVIASIFTNQKLDVLSQKIDLERDRLLNPKQPVAV